MALRVGFLQTNFPGVFSLLRSNAEATNAVYLVQYRCVQSQRDMKKDSRVVRPWHRAVEKFENKFQRKYPKIYKVYALFKQGTKDFIADSKRFYRVSMQIRRGEPLHKFSRSDLELLLQLPPQAAKVIPMIVLSILPFGFYLVIPLAYFFPRQLLCRQFWTTEQRLSFASLDVKRRLGYYDSVLLHLDETCKKMGEKERKGLSDVVNKLNSRNVPAASDVINAKPAFSHQELCIQSMPWTNMVQLARSVNLSIWRKRLHHSARVLQAADKALSRESVDLLSDTELRHACATRGLNPEGLSKGQMNTYLRAWLDVSLKLKENDVSLLLHTSTLLARNHPNNVILKS